MNEDQTSKTRSLLSLVGTLTLGAALSVGLAGGLTGCDSEPDSPAEAVENAGDAAADAVDDAADATGDAIDDAGDAIDDATDGN